MSTPVPPVFDGRSQLTLTVARPILCVAVGFKGTEGTTEATRIVMGEKFKLQP